MAGTGGAIMPASVSERFMTKTGITICETYGMTETAVAIAFNPAYGTAIVGSTGMAEMAIEEKLRIETEKSCAAAAAATVAFPDTPNGSKRVDVSIEDLPMVVIAAVGRVAVVGGLELLLCCDLIIAAQGVQIRDGHARYAIVPTAGATVRLAEKIGPARAAEMFYTAKLVSAETLRD
jgi:enoyl-CoA hydratase/carnithine racemase